MARYKLRTSQFGIVSGIRQDLSDRVSSAMPGNLFAPEARKGQMFILTEPVNDSARGKEACDLVAATITSAYYKDSSFSITSSLRKALSTANTQLYEFNFRSAHHQRTAVGLTCIVLRNNDLYVAQVQPTQVYIVHKGQLRALPTYPSWDPAATNNALLRPNALGTSLFSEPELYRNVIEPGDQVVLCSSRLAQVLGRAEAERLFCLSDTASAIEDLYELASRNSMSEAHVAVLELLPLINTTVHASPLSPEGISERGRAAMSVVGDWISDVTGNAALMLRRSHQEQESAPPEAAAEVAETEALEPHSGIHPTSALTEAPHLPSPLEDVDPRDMGWLRERPRYRPRSHVDVETWPPSAFLGEGSLDPALNAALPPQSIDLTDQQPLPIDFAAIPQRDPLPPPTFGERMTAPLRHFIAALVTFFANFGRRSRPAARPLPRFDNSGELSYRRRPRRSRIPLLLLVLLPALVWGGYYYLRFLSSQQAADQYAQVLTKAQQTYQAARLAPNDQLALERLDELNIVLDELSKSGLLTNEPVRQATYRNLVNDAERLQASIDRTSLLTDLEPVVTLPISDTIGRMLVVPRGSQTEIYALGRESGTLYHQIEGSPAEPDVVLKEGSEVGPVYVAPIRSIMWRIDNLAVIDDADSSSVYLRQPDGAWVINNLPASEFWPTQPFPDVETYGGHLYVWQWGADAASDQVEKYASGEFANLPTDWITDVPLDVDIQSAIDMSVDGNIYLLRPDGSIVEMNAGVYQRTIPAPQIKPPLSAARMYLTDLRTNEFDTNNPGHFFIIDTVNQRVVEMDKDGTVIQQIRMAADSKLRLDQLTDVVVTRPGPAGQQMYLANGSIVYKVQLPQPPPPRELPTATPPATPAAPTPTP